MFLSWCSISYNTLVQYFVDYSSYEFYLPNVCGLMCSLHIPLPFSAILVGVFFFVITLLQWRSYSLHFLWLCGFPCFWLPSRKYYNVELFRRKLYLVKFNVHRLVYWECNNVCSFAKSSYYRVCKPRNYHNTRMWKKFHWRTKFHGHFSLIPNIQDCNAQTLQSTFVSYKFSVTRSILHVWKISVHNSVCF